MISEEKFENSLDELTEEIDTQAEEITADTIDEQPAKAAYAEEKVETETKARWYVVHTYSGYENKVKADLEKTIENRKLHDQILEVTVPLQDVEEINKNGVKKISQKKMFPGYVLIHMIMTDDTWYVVRNTRGVTGFVGPGSKPVPLTPEEMIPLGIYTKEEEKPTLDLQVDFEVGDMIVVTTGAYEGTVAAIQSINLSKQSLTIFVEMGGRQTSCEIGLTDVKKCN